MCTSASRVNKPHSDRGEGRLRSLKVLANVSPLLTLQLESQHRDDIRLNNGLAAQWYIDHVARRPIIFHREHLHLFLVDPFAILDVAQVHHNLANVIRLAAGGFDDVFHVNDVIHRQVRHFDL